MAGRGAGGARRPRPGSGQLHRDRPAMAAGRRQTLGPATTGRRLRVQHDPHGCACPQTLLRLPDRRRCAGRTAGGHRPGASGTVPALPGADAAGSVDQGSVPGAPARLPGGEPSPPVGADHPGRGDDLPGGVVRSPPFAAPVHPGVRDGPTGIRGEPRPPAGAAPEPDRADHRDRAAGRGRLCVAVRPAAGRQRRLAVPAVRQRQDARRTPIAAVGSGGRGDPHPAGPRPPGLSRRLAVAVPVTLGPATADTL